MFHNSVPSKISFFLAGSAFTVPLCFFSGHKLSAFLDKSAVEVLSVSSSLKIVMWSYAGNSSLVQCHRVIFVKYCKMQQMYHCSKERHELRPTLYYIAIDLICLMKAITLFTTLHCAPCTVTTKHCGDCLVMHFFLVKKFCLFTVNILSLCQKMGRFVLVDTT